MVFHYSPKVPNENLALYLDDAELVDIYNTQQEAENNL
jgi:hypothetical protein